VRIDPPSRRHDPETKIVRGWPKLGANFRALIGTFRQSAGPSLAIWANRVQLSFDVQAAHALVLQALASLPHQIPEREREACRLRCPGLPRYIALGPHN
jgi:hypothetical protein